MEAICVEGVRDFVMWVSSVADTTPTDLSPDVVRNSRLMRTVAAWVGEWPAALDVLRDNSLAAKVAMFAVACDVRGRTDRAAICREAAALERMLRHMIAPHPTSQQAFPPLADLVAKAADRALLALMTEETELASSMAAAARLGLRSMIMHKPAWAADALRALRALRTGVYDETKAVAQLSNELGQLKAKVVDMERRLRVRTEDLERRLNARLKALEEAERATIQLHQLSMHSQMQQLGSQMPPLPQLPMPLPMSVHLSV